MDFKPPFDPKVYLFLKQKMIWSHSMIKLSVYSPVAKNYFNTHHRSEWIVPFSLSILLYCARFYVSGLPVAINVVGSFHCHLKS
jgi:hypothetical protein